MLVLKGGETLTPLHKSAGTNSRSQRPEFQKHVSLKNLPEVLLTSVYCGMTARIEEMSSLSLAVLFLIHFFIISSNYFIDFIFLFDLSMKGGLFAIMCRTDRVGEATLSLHYKSLIFTINRQGYWSIHLSLIIFD